MRTHSSSAMIAVLIWLCCILPTFAQTASSPAVASPPATRLKIGVALEGGGALGLAHIGVLQSLEDHDLFILPPFVGKKVYMVGSYEFAKMYGFGPSESRFPNDVAAGVLAETALGPFFIGGSLGDSGHRKWFFQIGKAF